MEYNTGSAEAKSKKSHASGAHAGGNNSDPVKDLENAARESARMLMDKAQEGVEHLKENCNKYVQDRYHREIEETTAYIRANPGKSILGAVIGGVILGLLLKR